MGKTLINKDEQFTLCPSQSPQSKSNAIIISAMHFGKWKPALLNKHNHALETHQTKADVSAYLFKHLLKAHIGHLCGCCYWNQS